LATQIFGDINEDSQKYVEIVFQKYDDDRSGELSYEAKR
jgi:hypothetical protein